MAFDFEIVDDTLRETLTGTKKQITNPLTQALIDGKTLFIAVEDGDRINGLYDSARRRGFSFRARKVSKDGTIGHLAWFEKKSAKKKPEVAK